MLLKTVKTHLTNHSRISLGIISLGIYCIMYLNMCVL